MREVTAINLKYRVYVETTRGNHYAGGSDTVNGLAGIVSEWLERSSVGRSIYDDQVRIVHIYELRKRDKYGNGEYVRSNKLPATSRKDIITKVRALGAR